jgi:gamma-glutamyltranspeptidase/glutathione hydrolase
MVAAGHPLAAGSGVEVLRNGGNAVDAAIAAAATLSIVSPHECGLGGDLFALVFDAHSGRVHGLNASGRSPAGATLEAMPGGSPDTGPLSITVPGMVGGWGAALERFGSRPLAQLLVDAIHYAEEGFPAYDVLLENASQRTKAIFADPGCRAFFFPGGQPLKEGQPIRQPAAARTLRFLAEHGARAFYGGPIAGAIAGYVQSSGGLLSLQDLADFEPLWQTPLAANVFDREIHTMAPNSWGAALLLQLMQMERDGAVSKDDAEFTRQGMTARKNAYRALAGCIADPDVAGDRAATALRSAAGSLHWQAGGRMAETPGADTSQVLSVDRHGNAVALLQSISAPFGSGLLASDVGVLLNNRMRGFNAKAGDPNCLAPRKRPAHTLAPALALHEGKVDCVCATPGGPGQTATVAQYLCRVLARGESPAEAISAPRWSINVAGEFLLEESASEAVHACLAEGEPAVKRAPWGSINFGSLAAIHRQEDGWLGCADLRRNTAVIGY